MGNLRRKGLIWVLLCIGISVLWGTSTAHTRTAWLDFRAVYAGTRCLMHGHDPYSVVDLEREYLSEDGQRPSAPPWAFQSITLYVNVPTTFVFVAPFAALPWGPACALWMLLTGGVLILAILLMWNVGASHAPKVATFLACILAVNCESFFDGGNTAGIVVGLCVIAVWCFLQNRLVRVGILCLGLSIAIKPHDAGLVWLYFVLAGGIYRKRALQSVMITAAIGLTAALWVSHVAPHWMYDWNANLATISAPGGINDPGPNAVVIRSISIVDLQAAISFFHDDPRFYNMASYMMCGALLLLWSIKTLRTRISVSMAWLALAAVVPITLLITYHRVWDAKLVMLAIPACCLLWAEGGPLRKVAVLITSIATLLIGEVSLAIFEMIFGSLHVSTNGILAPAITVVQTRPASLALLAMGVFYLWTYLRRGRQMKPVSSAIQEIERVSELPISML